MASASIKKIAFPGLAAILSVLALRASAADAEPYFAEYRAYKAAMESGALETAKTHGLAAWKSAEETLGNHRLTGVLAYNYGQLIVFSAPEQAAVPLRRANELSRAGLAELPQDALRLYLSYAEFAASELAYGPADDLREALNTVGLENEALIREVAPMWLRLAGADVAREEYRKAGESAAKAEAAIKKANPDARRELAQAVLLGAVATIGGPPRTIDEFEAANHDFARARRLFPPQKDLDSFDPLLAQVMTWHNASWNAMLELYEKKGRKPPDSEDDDDSEPPPPMFQYEADESLECADFEWEERKSPRYPAGALHDGYLGAVMLGYRLGEDLKVRDARIMAEVPSGERFGKVSLAALSEWRPKSLPSGGSDCHFVTFINFVID